MLTARERLTWNEMEQTHRAEAADVPRDYHDQDAERSGQPDQVAEVPATVVTGIAVVVIGVWATVVLLAVGAVIAAAAVGLATALAWRFWPLLRESYRENRPVADQVTGARHPIGRQPAQRGGHDDARCLCSSADGGHRAS